MSDMAPPVPGYGMPPPVDPVGPTEVDPVGPTELAEPPGADPPPAPRRRWPLILLGFLLILGAAGAYLWFFVVRPTPLALHHMPRGCNLAIRADAYEILTFKPVREHLWPVLLQAEKDEAKAPDATKKRLDRLREATGVRIPEDLRELIVASVDGKQWVAVLAGHIARGRFVDGLEKVLKDEGATGWTRDGDLLLAPFGLVVGQADDGTLVAGSDKKVVLAALPERDDDPDPAELPLPSQGAVSFLLTDTAYRGALTRLPPSIGAFDTLAEIERLNGTITLSESPRLDVRLLPKGVKPDKLANDLDGELSKLKLALLLVPSDLGGAKQAIGGASVAVEGRDVHVGAPWPYEPLDRAVADFAGVLAGALARAPQPK